MNEHEHGLVRAIEHQRAHFFGKYRGLVHEVGDGDELGLVRVLLPAVYGPEQPSPWAEPVAQYAGAGYGTLVLPQVGDGVWVEFVAGDPSAPIWSGGWWAGPDHHPEGATDKTYMTVTPAGHKIIVDDDAGELRLEHASGAKIVIADGEIRLEASSSATIVLSDRGVNINDGAVTVS